MEKKINTKLENYIVTIKQDITEKIKENCTHESRETILELLEYICNYPRLVLSKEDFEKRKRVKNSIPVENRCNARLADKSQCTRRRAEGSEWCGTHSKGTPNGIMVSKECMDCKQKIEVCVEEIYGILHYLDNYGNAYCPEDIALEKENPRVIAKYVKQNGKYAITEYL